MAFRPGYRRAALAVALSAAHAASAQTVIYSDTSTPDKLQSQVAVGIDEAGLSLQGATMSSRRWALRGRHGFESAQPAEIRAASMRGPGATGLMQDRRALGGSPLPRRHAAAAASWS
jgi:hypothetical protein